LLLFISSMNSYFQYSFGAVVEWMYRTIAGIDMLKPGFENGLLSLNVTTPPNTTAKITMPGVMESGNNVFTVC